MASNKLDTLRARRSMVMHKAKTLLDTVERENRAITPDEEKAHAQFLAEIDSIDKQVSQTASDADMMAQLEQIQGGAVLRSGGTSGMRGSWGDRWVAASRDWIKNNGHRASGTWQSPAAMIPLQATTLTEDPASG